MAEEIKFPFLPQAVAAQRLGISTTTLRMLSTEVGMPRWRQGRLVLLDERHIINLILGSRRGPAPSHPEPLRLDGFVEEHHLVAELRARGGPSLSTLRSWRSRRRLGWYSVARSVLYSRPEIEGLLRPEAVGHGR